MRRRPGRRHAAILLSALPMALLAAGCMGYVPPGTVGTPAPPGQSGETRLPQLLQQLQGAGAGLELFDATPLSEVLAAQDADGGKADVTPSTSPTATPTAGTPTSIAQVPPSTTPASGTVTPGDTPTPTATPTPTPTPTPTSQPSEGDTPTPTPTPTLPPTPPSEGGNQPPTE